MTEQNMIMKIAKFNIYDIGRGLNMNRGVYVLAPPDFFLKYGKSMEVPGPKRQFDEKEHHLMKIENWPEIKAKLEDKIVEKRAETKPALKVRATINPPTVEPPKIAAPNIEHQPKPAMSTSEAAVPAPRMTAAELLSSGKNKGVDSDKAPAAKTTSKTAKPKTAKLKAKAKAKPRKARVI